MALGQVKMINPNDASMSDKLEEEQYDSGNRSGRSTPEWWPQYSHHHATGCGDLSGRSSPVWSPQLGAGSDATGCGDLSARSSPVWSPQLGAGSVATRRPFRVWLLSVIIPNGKQINVMWNRKDCVSHVKKYLDRKSVV